MENHENIVIENDLCRLTVGKNCIVKSLIIKETGEECLQQGEDISLFSVTQERPFNNEIKLAHPNKRTSYQGNSLEWEGDKLIAGFELAPYSALIAVKIAPTYIAFTLTDFRLTDESYPHLDITPPPAAELRLIRLPVRNRENFGEWLNVSWDKQGAVSVLGLSPYTIIDSEKRKGYRIMTADAVKGLKLRNCPAALIAAPTDRFFNAMEALEEDYNLPRGVRSRRNHPAINSSEYWTAMLTPQNADEHIAYAKMGGFRMMLIYYTSFCKENGYFYCGDYDFNSSYPNGKDDLKAVLTKLKEAGITPGLHILQTHIGMKSRYITPTVDHRLNLKQRFTLARSLGTDDTEVFVNQNPEDSEMCPKCRYLTFGGELVYYEAFTTEPPYRFTGCKRGQFDTAVSAHPRGLHGGILDISEYGAMSAYIDQTTDLQDEIAQKIAEFYNLGFEFMYFDGSEGAGIPYGVHIPNAQYRVYKKLETPPLFTEGAAKAHFGWHHQSGGNAFDVFPPEQFKAAIDKYPLEEAPRMRKDFTRINFGWWNIVLPSETTHGTQPDLFEYGTSRAAAWDCPVAIQFDLNKLQNHPRTDDLMEIMRRWEDVRFRKWLTAEQKELLRQPKKEHILLINEEGDYELTPYEQTEVSDDRLRVFLFERKDSRYAVYWHTSGTGQLELPLKSDEFRISQELGGTAISTAPTNSGTVIPVGNRRYLETNLPRKALAEAFRKAKLL